MSDRGTTHSFECYKWHHDCAKAEVDRLRETNRANEGELKLLRVNVSRVRASADAIAEITSLRAELLEMTKQRDHHASTIFINGAQIEKLRAEVARNAERIEDLANDLADALDLKNGCGPTVLTALVAERDALLHRVQYLEERFREQP